MQIGTVFPTMRGVVPGDCLLCDGATHLRTSYPALYAVLDAAYIVDADHFKVPDLRGRTPIGSGAGPGLTARAVNAQGGEETHVLTRQEMPAHSHKLFENGLLVAAGASTALTPWATSGITNTDNDGGGQAHNNMQPWSAVKYVVQAL